MSIHPFGILSIFLCFIGLILRVAPSIMHRLVWERSVQYRRMPGVRDYFEKWDPRHESAPKIKNQYKTKFERISSFVIVAGLIFLAFTISMGGLDSPEEVALYIMLLIILALLPVYGYRRIEVVPLIRTTCLGVIFPVNHAAISDLMVS